MRTCTHAQLAESTSTQVIHVAIKHTLGLAIFALYLLGYDFDGVVELENGEKIRVEVAEKDKTVWDMREFDREQVMGLVLERLGAKRDGGAA